MTIKTKTSYLVFASALLLTGLRAAFAAPENVTFDGIAPAVPAGVAAVTAPAPAARLRGGDATAEYQAALAGADAALTPELVNELRKYKVLLVPGLFSNVDKTKLPVVGIFCSPEAKPRYQEHMALLKSLGVEVEQLKLQTESSIQTNAPGIAAAIKASSKPVILMGSSKAGLDTLEALVSEKALLAKVRGVVMLQVPFYGTPVADAIVAKKKVGTVLAKILNRLGGSLDSLRNLTMKDREIYMRENSAAIAEVAATVPVISVATWADPVEKGERDTGLKPLRNYMLKRGLKNDGLVPVDSAVMPGSDVIKIAGADHGATAQPTKLKFDRVAFTKAVLIMMLAR
ncbi:MAG TPA: hypothetical protein PKI19_08835 [Elusimicrobiales bacterium]|nr:hypothetical protein [Elusimicrobiales bacterium]